MKNVLILLFALFLGSACNSNSSSQKEEDKRHYLKVNGKTMGTYYSVSYNDSEKRNLKKPIDSLLEVINMDVSTYIDVSLISQFNKRSGSKEAIIIEDNHFAQNLRKSRVVYQETEGAFDPTVMQLVNYWGFGYSPKRAVEEVDSIRIDSIMDYVGFTKLRIKEIENRKLSIIKPLTGIQLDFSALAKGYGVDALGHLLEQYGISDYLVDIGGEMVARGKNAGNGWWQVGVRTPKKGVSDIESIISLENQALATSGNYENFYEVNGRKYGHTINPKSGYPEISSLLSATVLTSDCMTADAYATAFMVMGLDRAFELASETSGLEACFIYGTENGELGVMYTEGLKEKMY